MREDLHSYTDNTGGLLSGGHSLGLLVNANMIENDHLCQITSLLSVEQFHAFFLQSFLICDQNIKKIKYWDW